MDDAAYMGVLTSVSSFNSKLRQERQSRSTFLDNASGIAQRPCPALYRSQEERLPGTFQHQYLCYPAHRWRKRRRRIYSDDARPMGGAAAAAVAAAAHADLSRGDGLENGEAGGPADGPGGASSSSSTTAGLHLDSNSRSSLNSAPGVGGPLGPGSAAAKGTAYYDDLDLSDGLEEEASDDSDYTDETYGSRRRGGGGGRKPARGGGTTGASAGQGTGTTRRTGKKRGAPIQEGERMWACQLCDTVSWRSRCDLVIFGGQPVFD